MAAKPRIVVTGKQGQVVSALQAALAGSQDHELICLGRPEADFTRPDDLETLVASLRPDYVVNAAAYTAVDKAEDEPDLAMLINADAAGAVARGAARCGAPVIQISTDYVFDGQSARPYREDDPVGPIGAYGRSKLAGELAVAAENEQHIILRTAWVYSPYGANFVKTMLRYGAEREVMTVVNDQHGNPTSALDLASGILQVIGRLATGDPSCLGQVFHFAGQGDTTWYGFAQEIFRQSAKLGGPAPRVLPIPSSEFPTKAMRPANSRLDCTRFQKQFGFQLPEWEHSLTEVLQRLI